MLFEVFDALTAAFNQTLVMILSTITLGLMMFSLISPISLPQSVLDPEKDCMFARSRLITQTSGRYFTLPSVYDAYQLVLSAHHDPKIINVFSSAICVTNVFLTGIVVDHPIYPRWDPRE